MMPCSVSYILAIVTYGAEALVMLQRILVLVRASGRRFRWLAWCSVPGPGLEPASSRRRQPPLSRRTAARRRPRRPCRHRPPAMRPRRHRRRRRHDARFFEGRGPGREGRREHLVAAGRADVQLAVRQRSRFPVFFRRRSGVRIARPAVAQPGIRRDDLRRTATSSRTTTSSATTSARSRSRWPTSARFAAGSSAPIPRPTSRC